MNKNLLVIGIMLVFLMLGLSGCFENNDTTSGDDRFELVTYSVESWEIDEQISTPNMTKNSTNYPENFVDMPTLIWPKFNKIGDGFIGTNENVDYYKINATVKNKAGYKADIKVILRFYDENDVFLDTDSTIVQDIPDTTEKSFTKYYLRPFINNWSKVDKVTFTLTEG